MAKKKFKMNWKILAVLAVIGFFVYQGGYLDKWLKPGTTTTPSGSTSLTSGTGIGDSMMKVRLYDLDGNLIATGNTMSIVGTTPGVGFIDITVLVLNNANVKLSCDIPAGSAGASPAAFDTALTRVTKALPATGDKSVSWTSGQIDVRTMSGSIPFTASVVCSYGLGTELKTLAPVTGSITLTISPDVTPNAPSITVQQPALPSDYCGNGVCNAPEETATTCPQDCATVSNVKFRTSDRSYQSGQAIAINEGSCGLALTAYGYVGTSGTLAGTCGEVNVASKSSGTSSCAGATAVSSYSVPGGWKTGGLATPILYWGVTNTAVACICDDDGTNYEVKIYNTADSDRTKITNLNGVQIDSSKEVTC